MTNTTTEQNTETASSAPQVPPANETATDLNLQDLVAIKNIIDIASSRGAFKPNEMIAIGTLYSKLEKFLNSIQKGSAPNA